MPRFRPLQSQPTPPPPVQPQSPAGPERVPPQAWHLLPQLSHCRPCQGGQQSPGLYSKQESQGKFKVPMKRLLSLHFDGSTKSKGSELFLKLISDHLLEM